MKVPFWDLAKFQRDPLNLLLNRALTSEEPFTPLCLGLKPIWLATDPSIARSILKWDPEVIDKGRLVQTLQPLLGKSLLTNIGNEHAKAKHAMHRYVHRNSVVKNLDRLIAIINEFISRAITKGFVDTNEELAPLAFQLACVIVFGHDVLSTADRTLLVDAVRTVEAAVADNVFRLPFLPRMPKTLKLEAERLANASEVIRFVVGRARSNPNKSGLIRGLEESNLDDHSIISEILGLLIAGHHTTGATMGWLIHHLSIESEIASAIAAEANEVLFALEQNDTTQLKQATTSAAFVSEILRLYPAGWWTSREFYKPAEIAGRQFNVGDTVMVAPWQLHRDSRYWDRPNEFDVSRNFTVDAYMPFGIGPRACIGMSIAWFELQLLTLQFAASLHFERIDKHPPMPHPSITLLFPPSKYRVGLRSEVLHKSTAA